MADQDLREKLRAVVAEIAEIDEVPDDVPFKELGIDSMMAIEIVAEIERTYKMTVPEDDLKKLTNFMAVYTLVSEKLGTTTA